MKDESVELTEAQQNEAFEKGRAMAFEEDAATKPQLVSESVKGTQPDGGGKETTPTAVKEEPKSEPEQKAEDKGQDAKADEAAVIPEKKEAEPVKKETYEKERFFDPDESKEKILHRLKTTDGMFRATNKELTALKREIAEERKSKAILPQVKDVTEKKDNTGITDFLKVIDELPAVLKLKETYGEDDEIGQAIRGVAENIFNKFSGTYEDKIKELNASILPMSESYRQLILDKHYADVQKIHPDALIQGENGWESPYLEEIRAWIGTLPNYKQGAYTTAFERGNAIEIADLISDFKDAMGYGARKKEITTSPEETTRQKEGATKKEMERQEALQKTKIVPNKPGTIATDTSKKEGTFEDGRARAFAE